MAILYLLIGGIIGAFITAMCWKIPEYAGELMVINDKEKIGVVVGMNTEILEQLKDGDVVYMKVSRVSQALL